MKFQTLNDIFTEENENSHIEISEDGDGRDSNQEFLKFNQEFIKLLKNQNSSNSEYFDLIFDINQISVIQKSDSTLKLKNCLIFAINKVLILKTLWAFISHDQSFNNIGGMVAASDSNLKTKENENIDAVRESDLEYYTGYVGMEAGPEISTGSRDPTSKIIRFYNSLYSRERLQVRNFKNSAKEKDEIMKLFNQTFSLQHQEIDLTLLYCFICFLYYTVDSPDQCLKYCFLYLIPFNNNNNTITANTLIKCQMVSNNQQERHIVLILLQSLFALGLFREILEYTSIFKHTRNDSLDRYILQARSFIHAESIQSRSKLIYLDGLTFDDYLSHSPSNLERVISSSCLSSDGSMILNVKTIKSKTMAAFLKDILSMHLDILGLVVVVNGKKRKRKEIDGGEWVCVGLNGIEEDDIVMEMDVDQDHDNLNDNAAEQNILETSTTEAPKPLQNSAGNTEATAIQREQETMDSLNHVLMENAVSHIEDLESGSCPKTEGLDQEDLKQSNDTELSTQDCSVTAIIEAAVSTSALGNENLPDLQVLEEAVQEPKKKIRQRFSMRKKEAFISGPTNASKDEETTEWEEINVINMNLPNGYPNFKVSPVQIAAKKKESGDDNAGILKAFDLGFVLDQAKDNYFDDFLKTLKSKGTTTISQILLDLVFFCLEMKSSRSNMILIAIIPLISNLVEETFLSICNSSVKYSDRMDENSQNELARREKDKALDKLLNILQVLFENSNNDEYQPVLNLKKCSLSNPLVSRSTSAIFSSLYTISECNYGLMDKQNQVRFNWITARLFEKQGNATGAVLHLNQCKDIICEPVLDFMNGDISFETILEKLKFFEQRVLLEETKRLYNAGEFEKVVERLEPLVGGSSHMSLRQPYIEILRLSAFKIKRYGTWVNSCVASLDIDEWEVANYLPELARFISESQGWRLLALIDVPRFCQVVITCLQKYWHMIKQKTRNKGLADYLCYLWIIFLKQIKGTYKSIEQEQDQVSEIMEWIHSQLGHYNLCGGAGGDLLKDMVVYLGTCGGGEELYQCYRCLYGTSIKLPSQKLEYHGCKTTAVDMQACAILYQFIEPLLIEKIKGGVKGGRELVDGLGVISYCVTLPDEGWVVRNMEIVKRLLAADIDPLLLQGEKRRPVFEAGAITNQLYNSFYYVQGKLTFQTYLVNSNPTKSEELIKAATESFINHVALKPNDVDAWISLAVAFSSFSNDLLGASLGREKEKIRIAEFQKSAFACFSQAAMLIKEVEFFSEVDEVASRLWNNFGLLCRSIVSGPMYSEALKNERISTIEKLALKAGISVDGKNDASESLQDQSKRIYETAAHCFENAIRFDQQWLYYLSLAHTYRKLCKDPSHILYLYMKGIFLMPRNKVKEQDLVLDPIYRCLSFIIKCYHMGRLEVEAAMTAMTELIGQHEGVEAQVVTIGAEEDVFNEIQDPVLKRGMILLEAVKRVDKKKWYHRPSFRIAWLWSVVQDDERAKEEIVSLLNIKSKFRRIWKTDLEAHGRHYVYFTRYITWLVDYSEKTQDIPVLVLLCKRLLVEENIIGKTQIRNEARRALLSCLVALQPDSTVSYFKRLLSSVPSVDPEIEKMIHLHYEADPSNELHRLVLACEMKRTRKQCEPDLEEFILNLYSKLYLLALEGSAGNAVLRNPVGPVKETKLAMKIMQRALSLVKSCSAAKQEENVKV